MFDAPAEPCESLANVRLRLSYNPRKPDGQRLTLHAGKRAYSIKGIHDSDLRPIAMFADSEVPVLANIQSPDAPIRESCPLPSNNLYIVSLHEAVVDTQLGWDLTRMDSIPWSFRDGERWDKKDEPLPDDTLPLVNSLQTALVNDETQYMEMWPVVRSGLFNQGVSILKGMSADYKTYYARRVKALTEMGHNWKSDEDKLFAKPGVDVAEWRKLNVDERRILLVLIESLYRERVSNFNDDEAPPLFCRDSSNIKLDGLPNLQFIAPRLPENFVLPDSSNLMTENLPQLRLVEPEAYDGMVKIYRLAGLFRYVKKQQTQALWKQFLNSLPPPQTKDTYVVLCPGCEKDKVEQWWKCAGKSFAPTPAG